MCLSIIISLSSFLSSLPNHFSLFPLPLCLSPLPTPSLILLPLSLSLSLHCSHLSFRPNIEGALIFSLHLCHFSNFVKIEFSFYPFLVICNVPYCFIFEVPSLCAVHRMKLTIYIWCHYTVFKPRKLPPSSPYFYYPIVVACCEPTSPA